MKMLKIAAVLSCAALVSGLAGCTKPGNNGANSAKVKIGIAKPQAHVALDAVEKGIMDVITEAGIDAEFDLQNSNGDENTATQIASKYKNEHVALAVGIATPMAVALATQIKDTPIVFATITDPIGAGLVSTLEHGEGNITGSSDAVPTDQHIALFKDTAGIKTLGYIYASNEDNSISSLQLVKEACESLGLELVTQSITNSSEVKQAAEAIVKRVDGIYLTTDNTVFSALASIVQVFGEAKKPVFSADVTGAMTGGCLIASGFNYYKAGRATGEIAVNILKDGANPADIPVRFMTEPGDSDLLLDLDAAKNCGITFSAGLLSQANMIFENGTLTER